MLIVPADPRFRQGRVPWVTALIIALNVLVHATVQWRDDTHRLNAFKVYFGSDLPAIEFPLYIADLRARGKHRQADELEQHLQREEGVPVLLALERDAAFRQRLRSGAVLSAAQQPQWQEQRGRYEAARERIVTDRYAFDPDAPSALTLFTSMFLHGGIGHLAGNMVMLGLVGVLVEYALGPALYAALYVLGGLAAGATYWLVHWRGGLPVIGASGAIAAVMGLFAVLYGMRKVRFFYTLVFYFDFIVLPALVLLPYWLGWEVLQLFVNRGEPVAYEAHAGGLAAGAVLALLARRRPPDEASQSLDKPDDDARWERTLQQGVAHLTKLEFERARVIFEKLNVERPRDLRPVQHLFRIARAQPASAAFHKHAHSLLAAKPHDLNRVLDEYLQHARPQPRLPPQLYVQLLNRYAVAGDTARVDRLMQQAPAPADARTVAGILTALAQRVPPEKARSYRELAARFGSA